MTALLERNPFAEKAPQYIRAQFYDYTFSSAVDKRRGIWWQRRRLGLYFPEARLKAR